MFPLLSRLLTLYDGALADQRIDLSRAVSQLIEERNRLVLVAVAIHEGARKAVCGIEAAHVLSAPAPQTARLGFSAFSQCLHVFFMDIAAAAAVTPRPFRSLLWRAPRAAQGPRSVPPPPQVQILMLPPPRLELEVSAGALTTGMTSTRAGASHAGSSAVEGVTFCWGCQGLLHLWRFCCLLKQEHNCLF